MRIATWNVNSVRQRIDHLMTWLKDCSPDIVCLQEIKCVDEAFPRLEIEAHALKGSARTLGASELLHIARLIEHRAASISADELRIAVDGLEAAYRKMRREFEPELGQVA